MKPGIDAPRDGAGATAFAVAALLVAGWSGAPLPARAQVVVEEDERTPQVEGAEEEKPPPPPPEYESAAPPPAPPPGAAPVQVSEGPPPAPAARPRYPSVLIDAFFHVTGGGTLLVDIDGVPTEAEEAAGLDLDAGAAVGGGARLHVTFVRFFGIGPMFRFTTQSPSSRSAELLLDSDARLTNFDLDVSLLGQFPFESGSVAFDVYLNLPIGLSVGVLNDRFFDEVNAGAGFNAGVTAGFRFWIAPRVFAAFVELGVLHRRTYHVLGDDLDVGGPSLDFSLPQTQFLLQMGLSFGAGGG